MGTLFENEQISNKKNIKPGLYTLGVLVVLNLPFAGFYYGTREDINLTITEKTVKRSTVDPSQDMYLVNAKQEGLEKIKVFKNVDSKIWPMKFNSSDVQANLLVNKEYNCEVYGWRVPLFSWYPNISNCEPVNSDKSSLTN